MTYPQKKYISLLEDSNVKRWYENRGNSSQVAADIALRSLGLFCSRIGKTPSQYASLPIEEMENVIMDYMNGLAKSKNPKTGKPYSPGYVENCLDSVRSWAQWNRKKFERKIKIKDADRTPTLEDERCPSSEELRSVLYADTTDLRTRVSIALMAFGGPRPEVQGNYLGLDGLRVKDIPELKIEGKKVGFKGTPAFVIIRSELSKMGHQYVTLLLDEGCEILKQYLERRLLDGEKLKPDSAVIAALASQKGRQENFGISDKSPFLRTPKISEKIREAMRAVGLPWRPYVWRIYFDTNLALAESKEKLSHAYVQFWMGHKGDMERTYTLKKHTLPAEMLDDMRSGYKRASRFLQTRLVSTQSENELKKLFLLAAHVSKEQIEKERLMELPYDELAKFLQERLSKIAENGKRQLVVPVNDVKNYIAQGYDFAANLGNGECVLKLPP